MQPEAILFDEVTGALDPEMVGEVLNVIREIAREGCPALPLPEQRCAARNWSGLGHAGRR
jgi:ABC-type histidine transport system ATPase subunit